MLAMIRIFFLGMCLTIASTSSAKNWNSGGGGSSSSVSNAFTKCMTKSIRQLNELAHSDPEVLIKFMGPIFLTDDFSPENARQKAFVKLAKQHDQPMSADDRIPLGELGDCGYSDLRSFGEPYASLSRIFENQRATQLRLLNNPNATYKEFLESTTDVDGNFEDIIARTSPSAQRRFMKDMEGFQSKMWNLTQSFQKTMAVILTKFDIGE